MICSRTHQTRSEVAKQPISGGVPVNEVDLSATGGGQMSLPREWRISSLRPVDSERECDVPQGNKGRLASTAASLRYSLLLWLQNCGALAVLREIRGCYRRIYFLLETGLDTSPLRFEAVRSSVPVVDFDACPTETHGCIRGIQTLEKVRPYLTLADAELFAQGWFQAIEYSSRTLGRRAGKAQSAPRSTSCERDNPTVTESPSSVIENTESAVLTPCLHAFLIGTHDA